MHKDSDQQRFCLLESMSMKGGFFEISHTLSNLIFSRFCLQVEQWLGKEEEVIAKLLLLFAAKQTSTCATRIILLQCNIYLCLLPGGLATDFIVVECTLSAWSQTVFFIVRYAHLIGKISTNGVTFF